MLLDYNVERAYLVDGNKPGRPHTLYVPFHLGLVRLISVVESLLFFASSGQCALHKDKASGKPLCLNAQLLTGEPVLRRLSPLTTNHTHIPTSTTNKGSMNSTPFAGTKLMKRNWLTDLSPCDIQAKECSVLEGFGVSKY